MRKQDFSPSILDFGPVRFFLARHFGFCYGVENAIELSYKAINENKDRRVFLLSQIIHNQVVNQDLKEQGVSFIFDTDGSKLISWDEISNEDVVIVPAFGTTIEIEKILINKGIEIKKYNTTCPFVEKVWKRTAKLGLDNHTVIIHGKPKHEETQATFSHSSSVAPSIVIGNLEEAKNLACYILGSKKKATFFDEFAGRFSINFDPSLHLTKVGVVNQTTMLATETQAIAEFFKQVMKDRFGEENLAEHFADTRDTLCYASNDNQDSTYELLKVKADLAIVVGGANSSNTAHIVELCEKQYKTFFIQSEADIKSSTEIDHFDIHKKQKVVSKTFLPTKKITNIVLSSGASCPDTVVDQVVRKVLEFFPQAKKLNEVLEKFYY